MREQTSLRHGPNHMATLALTLRDDDAIVESKALVVRCALVNRL